MNVLAIIEAINLAASAYESAVTSYNVAKQLGEVPPADLAKYDAAVDAAHMRIQAAMKAGASLPAMTPGNIAAYDDVAAGTAAAGTPTQVLGAPAPTLTGP